MTRDRLPARIAGLTLATAMLFVAAVGVSVLWLTAALDAQARAKSGEMVARMAEDLLGQVSLLTLDYAKWDDAARRVAARDLAWLDDNVGSSAVLGEAVQIAAVWGGEGALDRGWVAGGPEAGRPGLVDPGLLGLAERRLADVAPAAYEGAAFFGWQGGELYAFAAARIEVAGEAAGAGAGAAAGAARLLMGRRLDAGTLAGLGRSSLLADLGIVRRAGEDGRATSALADATGAPAAYLAWAPPRPGAQMLRRLLPPLAVVTLIAAGLATLGLGLVRRGAERLVEAERRWAAAAMTDAATGLPNRAAFRRALEAGPVGAAAPVGRGGEGGGGGGERAVILLDVNGFKRINDSIGHEAGDEVIRRLGGRLAPLVDDGCLLARVGGDEFAMIARGPGSAFRAEWLAHAAERAVAAPLAVGGHRLQVQAAVGFALGGPALSGAELLRRADLAMAEAKRQGLRDPVKFDAMVERAGADAAALEAGLRAALSREGEIRVAYQPVVTAEGGRLVRAEALARWTSPDLGPVPPDRFIEVAERAGLIIELGRKLLRLVCQDLAHHPDLRVSVNVSPLQLTAPDFAGDFLGTLRAQGVDPARVQVELTEGVVVDDPAMARARVAELAEAGVQTALDDFGTGYSSIGILRQMAFDTLKIDRSFVSGIDGTPDRLALVNAMILLAHAMGLRVVCEGVETAAERDTLRDLGCDLLQGYGIERPIPVELLAERWLAPAARAVA